MWRTWKRLLLAVVGCLQGASAFLNPTASSPRAIFSARTRTSTRRRPNGLLASLAKGDNILVLDHLNINHESGRHDLLKAFYFDILNCVPDPRKAENLDKGGGTLWANCGINQFHLPQELEAQVFDGRVVLEYKDLSAVTARCAAAAPVLSESKFGFENHNDALHVTCPWGNRFELRKGTCADPRGKQPGAISEPLGMPELCVNVAAGSNMAGIARFYENLVGAPVRSQEGSVQVDCGRGQILSFVEQANGVAVAHSDYHISMYVKDFQPMFERMEALSLIFVNPRFKRKAATLEEAVEQCMFRVRDIVDPLAPDDGAILRLEHEIRSPVKADGSKYKSCPLDAVVPLVAAPDNF